MPGDSAIDHELGNVQGQKREYNRKMKIATACLVCAAICTLAAYATIAKSAVLLMVLGVALVSAVAATLIYVAYRKISARKVQRTEKSLSKEEALSVLKQDISKDKLKHVLCNTSPEALEEVCKKISEALSDNTSIITRVIEQIEDHEEILELLDLADANSSHIDESIRRRDFGRAALTGRLEAYVVNLAAAGNYRKIRVILEYDPSFIYSTYGVSEESIIKVASNNKHAECVLMLKEFHKGIVEGFIKGDNRYRKCDPILSVLQVIAVDHKCALDMFTKLAKAGYSMRSSDLFVIPRGLRRDFEDVFLKYGVDPGKIGPTTDGMPKGVSTTRYKARMGTHALEKADTREEVLEDFEQQPLEKANTRGEVLEDFEQQLNPLEVPLAAEDAIELVTRYSDTSRIVQSMLNSRPKDAFAAVEKFIADLNVQGVSGVKNTLLEEKVVDAQDKVRKEATHFKKKASVKKRVPSRSVTGTEEACEVLAEPDQSSHAMSESYKKEASAEARQALYSTLVTTEADEAHFEGDKPHLASAEVSADKTHEAAATAERPREGDEVHLTNAEVSAEAEKIHEAAALAERPNEAWGISTYVGKVSSSIGKAVPNVSETISQVTRTGSILYNMGVFTGKRLTSKAVNSIKSHPILVSACDSAKVVLETVLAPFENNSLESESLAKIKETRETLGRDFSSDEALDLLIQCGSGVTANVVFSVLLNSSTEASKEVCKRIFDQGKDGIIATVAIANTKDPNEVQNLLGKVFGTVDNDLVKKQISQVLSKHLFDSLKVGGNSKISGILKYDPLYLYETENGKDLIETALKSGKRRDANMLKELHKEIVEGYIQGKAKYRDNGYSVLSSVAYVSRVSAAEACGMLDALIESGYEITANLRKWLRKNFPENAHTALDAVIFKKRASKNGEEIAQKSTLSSTTVPSSGASSSVAATRITNSVVDAGHIVMAGALGKVRGISNDIAKDKVDLKDGKTADAGIGSTQGSDMSDKGVASSVSTRAVNSATSAEDEKSEEKVSSMTSSVTALRVATYNRADKIR